MFDKNIAIESSHELNGGLELLYNTIVERDEIYYKILYKKEIHFIHLNEILVWMYSKMILNK